MIVHVKIENDSLVFINILLDLALWHARRRFPAFTNPEA